MMSNRIRFVLAIAGAAIFAACNLQEDASQLTARTATAPLGPSCSSCHGYPLQDTNHVYHLYHTDPDKRFNGKITCYDCHSQSIAYTDVVLRDSFYTDTLCNHPTLACSNLSTLDFPVTGDREDSLGPIIRTFRLDSVVSVHQRHPIPLPKRAGHTPSLTEYVTGLAHLNNQVDVVFDAKISDTARFKGQKASYNPTEETCSAVACHPNDTPYRFAAPNKGLKELD